MVPGGMGGIPGAAAAVAAAGILPRLRRAWEAWIEPVLVEDAEADLARGARDHLAGVGVPRASRPRSPGSASGRARDGTRSSPPWAPRRPGPPRRRPGPPAHPIRRWRWCPPRSAGSRRGRAGRGTRRPCSRCRCWPSPARGRARAARRPRLPTRFEIRISTTPRELWAMRRGSQGGGCRVRKSGRSGSAGGPAVTPSASTTDTAAKTAIAPAPMTLMRTARFISSASPAASVAAIPGVSKRAV